MPRRTDIHRILVVGSGPIIIGQACEFDYSGAQACKVIRKERPDALLSTVGGQTGLNLAVDLAEAGVLDKYGVELIGAKLESIKKAEDRLLFKDAMRKIGLATPQSQLVNNIEDGVAFANRIG